MPSKKEVPGSGSYFRGGYPGGIGEIPSYLKTWDWKGPDIFWFILNKLCKISLKFL